MKNDPRWTTDPTLDVGETHHERGSRFMRWLRGNEAGAISDSEYYVASHDWPAGATDQDVPVEEAQKVFDQFAEYYTVALEGLARTTVPLPEPSDVGIAGDSPTP